MSTHGDRFIIFFSEEGIKALAKCENYFADSTFFAAPKDYKQVFTLHASKQHNSIPSVFAVTQKKNEATYMEVFQKVKERAYTYGLQLNQKKIICDYEKAQYNAFKFHFTNAEIKGCWFHFCQAIYKRSVQEIGKKKVNDYTYKTWISKLTALALVPIDRINYALGKL